MERIFLKNTNNSLQNGANETVVDPKNLTGASGKKITLARLKLWLEWELTNIITTKRLTNIKH